METTGTLYVVATPIGNLEDISARAIAVLKQVDLIAAEDTRHSKRLLQHFAVSTPLTSYHDFSSDADVQKLLDDLSAGRSIALISDAGTPLISDPGFRLVEKASLRHCSDSRAGRECRDCSLERRWHPKRSVFFRGIFAS